MGGGSYGYLEQNGQRLYITGFDEYKSTKEKIGVWIDGKPIYRQIFSGSDTLEAGEQKSILCGYLTNFDILISAKGCVKNHNGVSGGYAYTMDRCERLVANGSLEILDYVYVSLANNALTFVNRCSYACTSFEYTVIVEYVATE